ncbi:MAG: molybdopterin cofactor-binding domain-containing protein [Acidobacteriota bacterium]
MKTSITRREFLQKSLAGAGIAIAVSITPYGTKLLSAEEAAKEGPDFTPNVWLTITPDDIVHVIVNKSEMGQGVYTSLPMIVADELDADWKQVRITEALAADKYKDPIWGRQSTGGSTTIRHMYKPLRIAGAAARQMLISAAADIWKVPESECEAYRGTVRHIVTKRSLPFGKLAGKAASIPVPKSPALKSEDKFDLIGSPVERIDVPDKSRGKAMFGIDTFVEGMQYAAIARPPAYGAKPLSFDKDAAMKVRTVSHAVPIPTGIAVCAGTPEGAWKGRDALGVKWDKGIEPGLDTASLEKSFMADLAKEGISARNDGDVKAVLGAAPKKIEATYVLPYLSHATMEPMNCTADVRRGSCEIWVPTQNQTGVLELAEKETGLKPDQIKVHTTYLGGGFGRRFEIDVVEEAVKISKATGRPIKLIWKREEDMQHDFYRPANVSRIEGAVDDKGRMTAWSHKIVCPSIFSRVFPGQVKDGIDPAAVEGVRNMEYEVPNLRVEYVRIDTPVPVGFWRSVGSSHNGFTVESFVDEAAHAAGKDPVEFRLGLLKNHLRAYRVLETVAEKAGWAKQLQKAQGRGVAQHMSFGSYIAQVAEVSVDKKDGLIKVHRVVCAVDCGPIVNPAIITAQMRGAIVMGLSAALKEAIAFAKGGVESSNFDNYPLLRMADVPAIEVHIIKSKDEMGGIGEPGLPPIAPAVANAVFNASGIRVRRLPMRPKTVLAAMKKA